MFPALTMKLGYQMLIAEIRRKRDHEKMDACDALGFGLRGGGGGDVFGRPDK